MGIFIKVLHGQDIYKSIEEKGANFLYLIVKNHVFADGNKRIAATLFIYFLNFYSKDGQLSNLFPLLESMWTIKSASYYLFRGNNDVRALNNSRNALNSVSIKSSRLRDYQESLESEYGDR